MTIRLIATLLSAGAFVLTGCQSGRALISKCDVERQPIPKKQTVTSQRPASSDHKMAGADDQAVPEDDSKHSEIIPVAASSQEDVPPPAPAILRDDATTDHPADASAPTPAPLKLDEVVQSIYSSYPMLQVAFYGRNIAAGEQLSAEGAWDLKLKADANNAPLGYYQTYRNGVGVEQPLYGGGEVFGGYKIGRGYFEPWYGNRETNDGGEFSAGIRLPLAQNRVIDERRANLWKATYGVSAVKPFIQAQIIEFIRSGSHAYWEWVASGLNLRIARELLDLAEERDDQIEGQVKLGARPEALLIDNHRLILSREVKLIEAKRKLQSTAIKLSLFYRMPNGQPIVPTEDHLPPAFPKPQPVSTEKAPVDIAEALSRRPELVELDFQHRIAQVDLQQAENQTLPELDATLWSAKDVGAWSSKKGNKTPFQAEAGLGFSVPLQRRKAFGKIAAVEAKLFQIATKRQFAEDKISTEVQNVLVTLDAAYRSISKAHESVKLAEKMEEFEVVKLNQGDSDLLLLNLREVTTFDARVTEVEALLHYYTSQADYRAALALDIAEIGTPVPAVPPSEP